MNTKTITSVVILLVVVVGGWFLASRNTSKSPGMIKIGVVQITSHPVFDAINAGIKQGFADAGYKEGENITFDFENAQGDNSANASIAQKFANSNYDLFMPLGTPSSQALANLIKNRPIIFGAVTDPVSAGLVKSNENPGANVTGTSDITLYQQDLELLKKLVPNAQKLGIVYNPGEANAQYGLKQTQKYAAQLGLTVITAPANSSSEVLQAARSIAGRVDAFYMLPDNTVISGQDALIKIALDSKKPLISIDESGVKNGALATLGTNYEKLGVQTAQIAIRVLKGDKPASIPVVGVTEADLFVNSTTAKTLGISIPADILSQAKQVYQ